MSEVQPVAKRGYEQSAHVDISARRRAAHAAP
jgi:hypothetical protein